MNHPFPRIGTLLRVLLVAGAVGIFGCGSVAKRDADGGTGGAGGGTGSGGLSGTGGGGGATSTGAGGSGMGLGGIGGVGPCIVGSSKVDNCVLQ